MNTFETELTEEQLINKFKEIVPNYTKEWSFEKNDLGHTLTNLFFDMYDIITQKSNQLPEKNKIAFLNTMNIKRTSAFAAKTIFQFFINEQAQKQIYIPKGTQIAGDDAEHIFETVSDFYTTNANLSKLYFYERQTDTICDVGAVTDQGVNLIQSGFNKNLQKLSLFLSNPELAFLKGKVTLELIFVFNLTSNANSFFDFLKEAKFDWHLLGKEPNSDDDISEFTLLQKSSKMEDNCVLLLLESQNDVYPSKVQIYGLDSFWLRCNIDTKNISKIPSFNKIQLNIVDISENLKIHIPPLMFNNDIKLAPKNFLPFGNSPGVNSIFYISDPILAKKNCEINIMISHDDSRGILVSDISKGRILSWEYWNGKVWKGLELSRFFYDPTLLSLNVSFLTPIDFDICDVNGIGGNWIRLRISSGNYGNVKFDFIKQHDSYMYTTNDSDVHIPLAKKIEISGNSQSLESKIDDVVIYHDLQYQLHSHHSAYVLHSIDDSSVLLLGLDKSIQQGPIQLLFLLTHQDSHSEQILDFHYYDGSSWKELYVEDETMGLSRNGIVRIYFPTKIRARKIFGSNLFWIKISCEKQDITGIKKILLNCVNGTNSIKIQELFDSTHEGTNFIITLENHVMEESVLEVWINETGLLTESQKSEMKKNQQLETIDDQDWVLWSEVDLLSKSKPTDRHFVVDKSSKTVMFGNNMNGKIPPIGKQNIQINYYTGGGKNGNKIASTLGNLIKNIPLVESVTNPIPADGGFDIERIPRVLWRGPNAVMNQDTCITSDDFVWVLLGNFPILYKVGCFFDNDNLEIITVPHSLEQQPTPNKDLVIRIADFLQTHTPPNLTAEKIFVHGPEYVFVSISAKVEIASVNEATKIKDVVRKRLECYLHPLFGKNMQGWNFGECVDYYDIHNMIKEIDNVDSVLSLTISGFDKNKNQKFFSDMKNPTSTISPKSLLCSYDHSIEMIIKKK